MLSQSFKLLIFTSRNNETVVETRAAKRRRLNSKPETKSKLSDLLIKKEESVDEIDRATVRNVETEAELIVSLNLVKTPDEIANIDKSAIDILNMKGLMSSFSGDHPDHFIKHCRQFINFSILSSAEILTIDQADTPLWFDMRYGRITASRIYQASRCKTKNGSLVDSIMGKRSGWSFAMQRGTNLEDKVFEVLKNEMALHGHHLKQCGFFLDETLPHFGASPDGISDDFVVEIKCPATPKTYSEYISVDKLQRKYFAQIQLQMHITKRKKALLGVADLNFEHNNKVAHVWIDYDDKYVEDLIEDANAFWIQAVYPLIKRKHFKRAN